MLVAELTVNEAAGVPPKLTAVAPVKLVPVMVTVVLHGPADAGVKEVMVGKGTVRYVNPANVATQPPTPVTETVPLAPAPTTEEMLVAELTVNEVAGVPPKLTAVAPVKFVPVIVTVVPVEAEVGVKEAMLGRVGLFLNTETVLLTEFAVAKSGLPSPSTSLTATENGCVPVAKSTLGKKLIVPLLPLLLKTETVELEGLAVPFATARSALPSPFKSAIDMEPGCGPDVKSTLAA
jgi:hypothetical protein